MGDAAVGRWSQFLETSGSRGVHTKNRCNLVNKHVVSLSCDLMPTDVIVTSMRFYDAPLANAKSNQTYVEKLQADMNAIRPHFGQTGAVTLVLSQCRGTPKVS